MNDEHDAFEEYLRQFRPQKPRTLPQLPAPPGPRARLLWGAITLAALVCGLVLWFEIKPSSIVQSRATQMTACGIDLKKSPAPSELTMGRLRTYTKRDPSCLDLVLSESSHRVLPNVEKSQGPLRELARDID